MAKQYLKNRYKLHPKVQKKYLLQVEKNGKIQANHLAKIFKIHIRTYNDWKRGKFALPVDIVTIIENKYNVPFPISKNKALKEWIKTKKIAASKGAYARINKYGSPGTPEGRRKGGLQAIQILKKMGIFNQPKIFNTPNVCSIDLAEFVGILLGDGHIDKGYWSITLNAIKDKQYSEYINNLIEKLFHFSPTIKYRKQCNVIIIYSYGVNFISYLIKLGLKIGNKVKQQITVPDWIIKNPEYKKACLKGLVDTDGCIFTHKYRVNNKLYKYKKLCFANRSLPLLRFVFDTLKENGFNPKLIDNIENKRVWLYNYSEVLKYVKNIGSHNHRILCQIQESCQSGNGAAC